MNQGFKQWLQSEKRLLPHTLNAYIRDLNQFLVFIKQEFNLDDFLQVDSHVIRSWFVALYEEGYKPITIRRKKAAIQSFFTFCNQLGYGGFDKNPVSGIPVPKPDKRITHVAKKESILSLLDPQIFPDSRKGYRDYTLLEILYGTGIRRGELINLKVGDFNYWKNHLKVQGKGGKERLIPLNRKLKDWLPEYLDLEGAYRPLSTSSYFFVTDKDKPLYPMYVQRVVKENLQNHSTVQQSSPHQLRHAFATHLLEKGADLNAIKALLGHQQLAATERYLNASVKHLKSIYQQAHPKAE